MTSRLLCLLLIFAALLLLPACSALDAGGRAPNDCMIVAARAQSELPAGAWSRLLCVRYAGQSMGHCYLIYELPGGRLVCYDATFGSRIIRPRSRGALDAARAADPRAVAGWYVEDLPR